MGLGKNFILTECIGVALLLVLGVLLGGASVWVFIVYQAAVLALFIADVIVSPRARHFTVTRLHEQKLYFKTDNDIVISVQNRFSQPMRITVKDSPIPQFEPKKLTDTQTVGANETADFTLSVLPLKRGAFVSELVFLRFTGVLGFCRRDIKVKAKSDLLVYPNLRDLSKYRLIIQKDRLLNFQNRVVRMKAAGQEFESLREYVPGDDTRHINWNATARYHDVIVNNYQPERNQPVMVLVDAGRGMTYSVRGFSKLDYAINAALILADIVNQSGDLSGLLVYNESVRSTISPGKGASHRNNLMEALYRTHGSNATSDYEAAFLELNRVQKRRSLVFIFTDFESMEEAEDLLRQLPLISRRHLPIIIFTKTENAQKIIDSPDRTTGAAFAKAAALNYLSERAELIRRLGRSGVKCVETEAEQFAITAVNKYLQYKM